MFGISTAAKCIPTPISDMAERFAKIYLEITNVCNLHCSFCPGHDRPPTFLPIDRFRELAVKLRPYTRYLYLHVMGEPLMHPELSSILSVCKELDYSVIITTNGTRLAACKEILLGSGALYKVNVSLHSMEANAGSDPEQYLTECADFVRDASEKGILCVMRLWNESTPELVGRNDQNIAVIGRLRELLPYEWEKNSKGYRIRHRLHLEWDHIFSWPDEDAARVSDHRCRALLDHFAVLCDGSVVPCCLDRNGGMMLGNLFAQTPEEILSSPMAEKIRLSLANANPLPELCRRCGFAAAKFPIS